MDAKKVIKIVGFIATAVGFGLSLVTDWVADKKLDIAIEEKLAEKMAEKLTEQA